MGARKAAVSFLAGMLMTVLLVVVIPVVVDEYIQGWIREVVGDTGLAFLTSDVIVTILIWVVILGFMIVLGAGGILRRFGVFGILGLIFAYWIMGDVTDAVLPLVILVAMLVVSWVRDVRKRKKEGTLKNR